MSKHHGKHRRGQASGESGLSALQRDVSHRGGGKKAKPHIKAEAEGESGAEVRPLLHRPPSSALWAHAVEGGDTVPVGGPGPRCAPAAEGVVTVRPGTRCDLGAIDADADGGLDKETAKAALVTERARIVALQERLYAEHRRSLLVVFQAIDTGGKDGTIRAVFEGVNPQGCRVWSFKVPSAEESDHDFLWRYHAKAPARGMINVFNRSHYEDVLVVRVKDLVPEPVWRARYGQINDFERMLAASGTTILKFFLHISKDEQRERLEARIANPDKHWKFDPADLVERKSWDAYQGAFADALTECSTPQAPWHVVPANRKWYRNLLIARTIADTLEAMDPRFPEAKADLSGMTVPE
ncbi:polyphosphate kinase 2 family protein [Methylobacterium flocculans]|uniref:polyphosphate kinase 2 family protein n=1 Tax=Methylobacterium flocculans TaxID=2984843 RepID=UPI0021F3257C|nr:polyphosphate kinase 2 family protein [Methylobacterium sp. FF17]